MLTKIPGFCTVTLTAGPLFLQPYISNPTYFTSHTGSKTICEQTEDVQLQASLTSSISGTNLHRSLNKALQGYQEQPISTE